MRTAALFLLTSALAAAGVVEDVREALKTNNFAATDRMVAAYRAARGETSELAKAISWQARGALAAKQYDKADDYAAEARRLSLAKVKKSGVKVIDSDFDLEIALGAAIEVEAQVLAARNERSRAVSLLQAELRTYRNTKIAERLSKNLNLLSLEGKPAPELVASEWIGTKPATLASLRGKPVLLFFWAHWCNDCKSEIPIIAKLMQRYGARGLTLMAPTRYYGYVAEGAEAPINVEKPYIAQVRAQFYSPLPTMQIPLSNANFVTWGCSSTPTLAMVDKKGIVSWYHPGTATEAELVAAIEKVI